MTMRRTAMVATLVGVLCAMAAPASAARPARIKLTAEPGTGCGTDPVVCLVVTATVTNYVPAETVGTFALYDRKSGSGPDVLVNDYVNQFWTCADGSNVIQISSVPCGPTMAPYLEGPYFKFVVVSPTRQESNIVKGC